MKTENLLPHIDDVEIQLTVNDMEVLREYVSKIEPPNCCIEIGTRFGGSALWIVNNVIDEVEVYSIDPNPILDAFNHKKNIGNLHFIDKTSMEVARSWNKPVGVLFIDGSHDQAAFDFGLWEKHLVIGGIVLFHDFAPHSPKVKADCHATVSNMEEFYKRLFTPDEYSSTSIFQAQKIK